MNNLKQARKAKGMTAEKLANKLGFAVRTINNYEQGRSEPDLETLKRISTILECSVDYLIGNDEGITISKSEYQSLIEAKQNLEKAQLAIERIEKRVSGTSINITGDHNSVNVSVNKNKKN